MAGAVKKAASSGEKVYRGSQIQRVPDSPGAALK